MVINFDDGVRTKRTCESAYMYPISQNKLMNDYAVGPGGSLNSLDLSYFSYPPLLVLLFVLSETPRSFRTLISNSERWRKWKKKRTIHRHRGFIKGLTPLENLTKFIIVYLITAAKRPIFLTPPPSGKKPCPCMKRTIQDLLISRKRELNPTKNLTNHTLHPKTLPFIEIYTKC